MSPPSNFGGPEQTSRMGQEDGWKKSVKTNFLKGKFLAIASIIS